MRISAQHRSKQTGFSVAELIIVVTVIGILASIVLVLWPGYQQRTRDAERKSDLSQIAAALNAYAQQKNDYMTTGSGCGLNGNGNGWFNAGPSDSGAGTYPQSMASCLEDAKVITTGSFVDPLNCTWASGGLCGSYDGTPAQGYMKATCQKSGKTVTYLFAHLETEPRKDSEVNALCDSGTVNGFNSTTQAWGTHYGMNYYVAVGG